MGTLCSTVTPSSFEEETPLAKSISESEDEIPATRDEIISALFKALDKQGTGRLLREQMLVLAEALEYDGSKEEFVEEYDNLCEYWEVDPQEGFDEDVIANLLDDDSEENDYYVESEEHMRYLLDDVKHRRAGQEPPTINFARYATPRDREE